MFSVDTSSQASVCEHSSLTFTTSCHADVVGYQRLTDQQRARAAGRREIAEIESESSFPAPLVLPGDELSLDPCYRQQSFASWVRLNERNEVNNRRNILYLAGPPSIARDLKFVRQWSEPKGNGGPKDDLLARPSIQDVAKYLTAFYHGVQVKILPPDFLHFSRWDERKKRKLKSESQFVGLSSTAEVIRIRARLSPDSIFQGQLNLDDLFDATISVLPDDGFALLMLVEHDLFEDDDDDFCCGRAYGGSRVALVSMARYNPRLDHEQGVERHHAWPASHCEAYVQAQSQNDRSDRAQKPAKKSKSHLDAAKQSKSFDGKNLSPTNSTPLQAALAAHKVATASDLSAVWFSRVCQTASHELGHCFGMDHCVSYACVMQSTSCLSEDVRQPPYLCPIDLAKVLRATSADQIDRYHALLSFCKCQTHVPMFAAYGAWLESRIGKDDDRTQHLQLNIGSRETPIEV